MLNSFIKPLLGCLCLASGMSALMIFLKTDHFDRLFTFRGSPSITPKLLAVPAPTKEQCTSQPTALSPGNKSFFKITTHNRELVSFSWDPMTSVCIVELDLRNIDTQRVYEVISQGKSQESLLLPKGTYKWRIRVQNSAAKRASWSKFQYFYVQEMNPLRKLLVFEEEEQAHSGP